MALKTPAKRYIQDRMHQPYHRLFNFSAGPSTLPVNVLEQARDNLMNFNGSGMSVMEMSHRSKPFEKILARTKADLRELLSIPDGYEILFLQGGATLQFSMVAMNFLPEGKKADYIITGTWGAKAFEGAATLVHAGRAECVFDGKSDKYRSLPDLSSLSFSSNAAYAHITSNETIQGVEFQTDISTEAPLICDMSSDILSRPVDVSKYSLIYAGAQKNMGPAGVTVVIIKKEFLDCAEKELPPMLDYRLQAENDSMYNTPPCWSIYMCGLVYQHLLCHGGVVGAQERNLAKSHIIYDAIDKSNGFYEGHAAINARSKMNVTFTLPSEELTAEFLKKCESEGLDGLKGHRSVGGCRASIYNAFPIEGCHALASLMNDFAMKNS